MRPTSAELSSGASGCIHVTKAVTAGHSYTLTLTNNDDSADPTSTKYDDVTPS